MSFPRRGSIAIRRTLPPLVAALVVAACTPAGPGNGRESPAPTGVAGGARPDVVLVLLDDARWDDLVAMPRTRALIGDEGVRFTSAYVVNPSCCPSRASILTGGYSHTTGVFANHPPYGGRPVFQQRGGESANIATSLHEAGYRTALIGKYMNANREPAPAPGWDRYFAFFDMNGRYYDYTISDDGDVVRFGDAPDDYSTDVFLRRATSFIRSTPSDQPLFLYFTPFAPHNVTVPAPGDEEAFATETWEPPPSFDERDVSDKPAYIRSSPPVRIEQAQRLWRGRLATLSAVDRAVESILETLADEHRLSDAVVIVTSDNGLALGEHRWRFKGAPYEEVIRVPLLLRIDRFDGVPARIRELALNIDLAPTIADLAGVEPLANADGRSLVPLLRRGADRWRRGFLLENAVDHAQHLQIPSYCGYHSRRFVYVRYATGESELYDLRRDPFQLDNRAGDLGYRSVQDRMAQLARSGCRPAPPEFSWVGTPAA